jgi:transposase
MTQAEEIAHLKKQLSEVVERLSKAEARESQLLAHVSALQAENQALQEQLTVAHKRLEELEKQKTPPPAFVKANVVKKASDEKQQRKKRAAQYNHARRREAPTVVVEHRIKHCPLCAHALGGISVARRRQVIELPPPPPVEVTEHVVYHGWCSQCGAWREAPLDVSQEVVGQGRFGVKIGSLIAYVRTVMRLPVRQIQAYVASLHGLSISSGEIIGLAQRVTAQLGPQLAQVKQQIRASPAVQMDETGWREDGSNGYVWCAGTPQWRYYEYQHSRGSEVVKAVLGERFEGVLGSDFLASYTIHEGLHQRCWVHFLRDRHELTEQYREDTQVQQWAKDVKALYDRAVAYAGPDPSLPAAKQEAARRKQQHAFEQELWQLCAPYAHTSSPLHTLCERVERFLPELFVFVARPEVPAHTNLAERSVRPLVIARKISGGTRSPEGSQTRMALFSLFGSWAAQGLNPFLHCLAVLAQPNPLG